MTILRRVSSILIFIVIWFFAFVLGSGSNTLQAAAEEEKKELIAPQNFLTSSAAEYFQAGQYEKALEALDDLLEKFSDDALLLRYRGMILDRMGKSQEAISIFQDLLKKDPSHAPTHYFLGQAYERAGDNEGAIKEWRWTVEQAKETPYAQWSAASLERIGVQAAVRIRPAVPQRLRLAVRAGYEFDSNVILRPNDNSLATSRDRDAGRYTIDLRTRYRAVARRDVSLDVLYDFRQSLHDDSLNEFNFTHQAIGFEGRKRTAAYGRDIVWGARYEFIPGFLDGDLFSVKNQWTPSAEVRFTPRTRTVFYDRLGVTNFGPDGSSPSRTSRDGFYQDLGATHYWYSADFRRYIFVIEEFNQAVTRGDNFKQFGNTTRIGIHSPVVKRTDVDVSSGLETGFYPDFSSLSTLDTSRRRDINLDIYAAVTHHLTSDLLLRVFYRFTNAVNQNNFFDYDRHVGGVQVVFNL